MNLSRKSVSELLALWVEVMDELVGRGVLRTQNNPTADLAERVACDALGLSMADKNAKGYDASGADGTRYQIKGRRLPPGKRSKPLGVVRDLDDAEFEELAVVLFDHDYGIVLACTLPYEQFRDMANEAQRLNGHRITAGLSLLEVAGAIDFTSEARSALAALE